MGSDLNQLPVTVANASGFPLQIGVIHAINQSSDWRVIVQEHPWRSDETAPGGFIDIVAMDRNNSSRTMIIECKRVKQAAWVFLIPNTSPSYRCLSSVWFSLRKDGKQMSQEWIKCQAEPSSYLSLYCAIPGQEQGRRTLIERTAADLVNSVEAIAQQELDNIESGFIANFSRWYVPVLVTTARLFAASFDPATVSLNNGSLPENTCCEEVPYIRFRKSLSVFHQGSTSENLQELNAASERVIFVVHAESITAFLNKFEMQ